MVSGLLPKYGMQTMSKPPLPVICIWSCAVLALRQVQVAIRNIRREAVDAVKKAEKAKSLGKDQVRRLHQIVHINAYPRGKGRGPHVRQSASS